jgi:hypothetical protein
MPDDIRAQPLLVEIAIEPLRLTVEITGAWLALA